METKRLDLSRSTFMANGNEYRVSQTMSIDRFMEFERLQAHVGFGKDFKGLYSGLKKAFSYLNEGKPADGAVVVHNMIQGIAMNLDEREHPALELCAIFINRKGEDETVYDKDVMTEKINDWRKEGYAIQDFFHIATNFVEDFIMAYEEITQTISDQEAKIEKSTGKSES